jgi:PTS system mannose-specific IIC component
MAINAFQAVLLGIFACLASLPGMAGTTIGNYTLGRPLVGGLVVGLILGDVATGIIVGAAIQVVYIALVTPGGTVSADVRAVTYIGIPLSILAIRAQGLDPSSAEAQSLAAALGAAVGTLGTVLFYGTATINLVWQGIGWKAMETKDWGKIKKTIPMVDYVWPWIGHILFSFIPTFIICMAGSEHGPGHEGLPAHGRHRHEDAVHRRLAASCRRYRHPLPPGHPEAHRLAHLRLRLHACGSPALQPDRLRHHRLLLRAHQL